MQDQLIDDFSLTIDVCLASPSSEAMAIAAMAESVDKIKAIHECATVTVSAADLSDKDEGKDFWFAPVNVMSPSSMRDELIKAIGSIAVDGYPSDLEIGQSMISFDETLSWIDDYATHLLS